MSIFIDSSKTDVYRDGHVLLISRIHSPICPVQTLCLYIKRATLTHNYGNYLFGAVTRWKNSGEYTLRSTNKPITYTATITDALDLIAKIVLNPRDFGLHSARSGGATVAANTGVPDRLFKRHGRWVSEREKDGNIEESIDNLLKVTQNLGL